MEIGFVLNGKGIQVQVEGDDLLIDVLRKQGCLSVKRGCDTGNCGLCTIWIDERPTLSCAMLAVRANGKVVTTLEGLQEEAADFARVLVGEGADQCGFCSPGFVMTVLAMKRELSHPTEEEIVHYLTGNLCRCTGYMGQLRAVKKYMGVE